MSPTQEMYDRNLGGLRAFVDEDPSSYPGIKTDDTPKAYAQGLASKFRSMEDKNSEEFKNDVSKIRQISGDTVANMAIRAWENILRD